jgi:hypothetical protein
MAIVFVHIPKTAGTSVIHAFRAIPRLNVRTEGYDKIERVPVWHQRILHAFQHLPLPLTASSTVEQLWHNHFTPTQNTVVCGHFYVEKYLLPQRFGRWRRLANVQYVTFLREPLQRAISKYYYTKSKAARLPDDAISRRFVTEFPTLTAFLSSVAYANIQTRYTSALPLEEYTCIGIVEELELSIQLLRHRITDLSPLTVSTYNQTSQKDFHEIDAVPASCIERFYARNDADTTLYRRAHTNMLQATSNLNGPA